MVSMCVLTDLEMPICVCEYVTCLGERCVWINGWLTDDERVMGLFEGEALLAEGTVGPELPSPPPQSHSHQQQTEKHCETHTYTHSNHSPGHPL